MSAAWSRRRAALAVNEPFGMVYLEAMACDTPPIATATGGLARTVTPHDLPRHRLARQTRRPRRPRRSPRHSHPRRPRTPPTRRQRLPPHRHRLQLDPHRRHLPRRLQHRRRPLTTATSASEPPRPKESPCPRPSTASFST
ncbi:glycosyltransferase [Yinghuangia aomiensis]|uniref:glycosyltransferase n=1 Tax=Yinghuangia aomiensis TaxID=676205 RepID=UPI003CD06760